MTPAGHVERGRLTCESCARSSDIKDRIWHALGPAKPQATLAQLTNVWPNALFYESLWRPGALTRFTGRSFPLAEELGELSAALRPRSGSVIVDVACSEGLYARSLAASGAVVFAVEHSVPMLRKVVTRAERESATVIAVRAIAQRLPINTGAVDGVAIGGSLNEIGDRHAAVSEMQRILAIGGRLFSMHLTKARTPIGKALQASVRPSGIVFDTADGWRRDLSVDGLVIESDHHEKIVQRMVLVKKN
jgi:SAM-dependent methyltransferase